MRVTVLDWRALPVQGATVVVNVRGPDGNEGHGSGTIIDAKRGLILTNAHVAAPDALGQGIASGTSDRGLPKPRTAISIDVSPGNGRAAEPRFQAELVAADLAVEAAGVVDLGEVEGVVDDLIVRDASGA